MTTAVALYTDGGCIGANPSPVGGTWAFVLVDAQGKRVVERSGILTPEQNQLPLVTNNIVELYAIILGLEAVPVDWQGRLYSDSRVSLQRLYHQAKLTNVPTWLCLRMQAILKSGRLEHILYTLLDGHPTQTQLQMGKGKRGGSVSIHNVRCDQLCTRQAQNHQRSLREAALL